MKGRLLLTAILVIAGIEIIGEVIEFLLNNVTCDLGAELVGELFGEVSRCFVESASFLAGLFTSSATTINTHFVTVARNFSATSPLPLSGVAVAYLVAVTVLVT